MAKASIITLFQDQAWCKLVRNIKGEAPHRLHNILLQKFNEKGRFDNKILVNPQEFTALMEYSDSTSLKRARKELVDLGLWEYHQSTKYDQNGRKQGYFAVPAKFLQSANIAPSETSTGARDKALHGADMAPHIDNIDRYIDDIVVKDIILKLKQADKPFAYKGNTAKKQAEQLKELIHNPLMSKKELNVIVEKIIDKTNINDAPNYLIASLRTAIKDKKKTVTASQKMTFKPANKKKRAIKSINWDQYATKHTSSDTPKMSDEEVNAIFHSFGPKGISKN